MQAEGLHVGCKQIRDQLGSPRVLLHSLSPGGLGAARVSRGAWPLPLCPKGPHYPLTNHTLWAMPCPGELTAV